MANQEVNVNMIDPTGLQLLAMVAAGKSSKEISRTFDIPNGSVRTRLSRIYRKLKVKGRSDAVTWLINHHPELVPRDPSQPLSAFTECRYVENAPFGEHALRFGLWESLGALTVYVGVEEQKGERTDVVWQGIPRPKRGTGLRHFWEYFLSGNFARGLEYGMNATDLSRDALLLVALMALLDDRVDLALEMAVDLSDTEAQIFASTYRWLTTRSSETLESLQTLANQLSTFPYKHACLVALFHGAQRTHHSAVAREAANQLFQDTVLAAHRRIYNPTATSASVSTSSIVT